MSRFVHRVMQPQTFTLLGAIILLAVSCSKSLGTLITEAVDGCVTARNPAFTSGNGAIALNTPLPEVLSKAADKIAYARGLANLQRVTEQAKDQVTLVCALEIASHYRHGDVAVLLYKFTKHPDQAVATNAKKLLQTTQDPLPPAYVQ